MIVRAWLPGLSTCWTWPSSFCLVFVRNPDKSTFPSPSGLPKDSTHVIFFSKAIPTSGRGRSMHTLLRASHFNVSLQIPASNSGLCPHSRSCPAYHLQSWYHLLVPRIRLCLQYGKSDETDFSGEKYISWHHKVKLGPTFSRSLGIIFSTRLELLESPPPQSMHPQLGAIV